VQPESESRGYRGYRRQEGSGGPRRRGDRENHWGKKRDGGYDRGADVERASRFLDPTSAAAGELAFERAQDQAAVIYNKNAGLSLYRQRLLLPIAKARDQILYALENFRVTVLVGETGSGKTTQVLQYLHEAGWTQGDRVVVCTQPRRIAAKSVAQRVAEEVGCVLGTQVGYAVRFDIQTSDRTKMKFITEGMLLREMMMDPLLRMYSVIMVDEAHERTIQADLLMGLLKRLLKVRLDLKVIVSSATLDADAFAKFFDIRDPDNTSTGRWDRGKATSTILKVDGRCHPVDVFYLKDPCRNYVSEAVKTVMKIHITEPEGDILVFLTGRKEIREAVSILVDQIANLQGRQSQAMVLPLYSGLTLDQQMKVFERYKGGRKIVVSTNIAETSVTIDGIVYVVDSCFVKEPAYNPKTLISSLLVTPCSQAASAQRKGRAGRVSRGMCFRMCPETAFAQLRRQTTPEMQRLSLEWIVLQLKALGVENVLRFDFVSPPPAVAMAQALELLYSLEVLDENCHLTDRGRSVVELPVDPRLGVMILASGDLECSEEILSMASMLTVKSVFLGSRISGKKREDIVNEFAVMEGDHFTLLNIFNSFILSGKSKSWCHGHGLNYRVLERAHQVREHLRAYAKRFKVKMESCKGDIKKIQRCICAGFFAHAASLSGTGQYRTVRGKHLVSLHPESILYSEAIPWVIYHEATEIANIADFKQDDDETIIFLKDNLAVNPQWLHEAAPHFYKIKSRPN